MAVTVEKTTYNKWGNCIKITNGTVEIFATLDRGPHIIRCGIAGKPNMFKEDPEKNLTKQLPKAGYFDSDIWHNFGGHRFWVSPEAYPQSYYPELNAVDYELIENGVVLKQKPQEFTQIQLTMTVTMAENGEITIVHTVTNKGAWPVELAPWALSVMDAGGVEAVPQATRDTDLLANRVLSVWAYTEMDDPRVHWGKKYIILKQDTNSTVPFKIGTNNEHGYAAYFLNGCLFIKSYEPVEGGKYPDFGVSYETYTNEEFLEMETLGTLKSIAHGESHSHTEKWNLYDNVALTEFTEDKIAEILTEYIK